jgi:hypothetical protein
MRLFAGGGKNRYKMCVVSFVIAPSISSQITFDESLNGFSRNLVVFKLKLKLKSGNNNIHCTQRAPRAFARNLTVSCCIGLIDQNENVSNIVESNKHAFYCDAISSRNVSELIKETD